MSNMFPDKCQRCGGSFEINGSHIHTTSMFNKEEICMACKDREKHHPLYKKAVEADHEHIRNGDYNFEGIGCPPDLYPKKEVLTTSENNANFIVICCAERTIFSIGTASTKEEAHILMKKDVLSHLASCGDEEYIAMLGAENDIVTIKDADDFGISSLGAWSNLNTDQNLDWAIIKINGGNDNG